MLDFSLLGKKTLVELVYEELKDRIMTGQMCAGDRVLEVRLAEELVISRTPVREAMQRLEMEGLLVQKPRKGIYVAQTTGDDLRAIMEIRQDVEGMAAYYAAIRINTSQINKLWRQCKNYSSAADNMDAESMMTANKMFHKLLIEASGNKVLMRMTSGLQEAITPLTYNSYCLKHAKETALEHEQILHAIESGDSLGAKLAAIKHINLIRPQAS